MEPLKSKKILVDVPLGLLDKVHQVRLAEQRTLSDLTREALRRYTDNALKARDSNVKAADNIRLIPIRDAQEALLT